MPSIQNFKEWTKERCRDAQNTYRDSQIRDYDHQLNGYTKETAYGKKHFFGTAEISQMFESATPELLRKITASCNVRQCCNFTKAPLKMPPSVTITSLFSSKIKLLVV